MERDRERVRERKIEMYRKSKRATHSLSGPTNINRRHI